MREWVNRGRVARRWGNLISKLKFKANCVGRDVGYQREVQMAELGALKESRKLGTSVKVYGEHE